MRPGETAHARFVCRLRRRFLQQVTNQSRHIADRPGADMPFVCRRQRNALCGVRWQRRDKVGVGVGLALDNFDPPRREARPALFENHVAFDLPRERAHRAPVVPMRLNHEEHAGFREVTTHVVRRFNKPLALWRRNAVPLRRLRVRVPNCIGMRPARLRLNSCWFFRMLTLFFSRKICVQNCRPFRLASDRFDALQIGFQRRLTYQATAT